MFRTYVFPIYPSLEMKRLLDKMIDEMHLITLSMIEKKLSRRLNSSLIREFVPFSSDRYLEKNAKSILKHKLYGLDETGMLYIKQKRHIYFAHQNFELGKEIVIKLKNGHVNSIPFRMTQYVSDKLKNGRRLSIKIFKKNKKFICLMLLEMKPNTFDGNWTAGMDIGVKVPAVVFTENQKVRFYKGGKYRRYLFSKQIALQKTSNNQSIKRMKVSKKLRDLDHKISSRIVKDLIKLNVKCLKIEDLRYIQHKSNRALSSGWSYERLQRFVTYKCENNGIDVIKVNPHFTSQTCPLCNRLNKTLKRLYSCSCGYKQHRDVVGARNIMSK